jgi:hypothetical protein
MRILARIVPECILVYVRNWLDDIIDHCDSDKFDRIRCRLWQR